MKRLWIATAVAAALTAASAAPVQGFAPDRDRAAGAEPIWDGLVRVESRKLAAVYLLPESDFRPYTKVMIDPVEVAFKKNWQRDFNRGAMGLSRNISDADVERILRLASEGFDEIIRKAYADAGYEVVTTRGPDVLRVRPAVFNLVVAAPDVQTAGRGSTWSVDVGEASVLIEVRDSSTNAVLGRALDRQMIEDMYASRRTSVSNGADFKRVFKKWAESLVSGLAMLKEMSPVDTEGHKAG